MSEPLRALIVDDEPLARTAICGLLDNDAEVRVVGECSGIDAAALIRKERPDILFLDIQMPEVDGFEVIAQVGADAVPAVVFVTAYDQYALRAFEVHALDYLLKPYDDRRFRDALQRAKERARDRRSGDVDERLLQLLASRGETRAQYLQRFLVRVQEKVVFVDAASVDWIGAADYYVALHVGGVSHLLRETMSDLEKRLDPERFVRIHRSTIVNVDRVREMHPLFRGDSVVVLTDGTRLRLSRGRREEFERTLTHARKR